MGLLVQWRIRPSLDVWAIFDSKALVDHYNDMIGNGHESEILLTKNVNPKDSTWKKILW